MISVRLDIPYHSIINYPSVGASVKTCQNGAAAALLAELRPKVSEAFHLAQRG